MRSGRAFKLVAFYYDDASFNKSTEGVFVYKSRLVTDLKDRNPTSKFKLKPSAKGGVVTVFIAKDGLFND